MYLASSDDSNAQYLPFPCNFANIGCNYRDYTAKQLLTNHSLNNAIQYNHVTLLASHLLKLSRSISQLSYKCSIPSSITTVPLNKQQRIIKKHLTPKQRKPKTRKPKQTTKKHYYTPITTLKELSVYKQITKILNSEITPFINLDIETPLISKNNLLLSKMGKCIINTYIDFTFSFKVNRAPEWFGLGMVMKKPDYVFSLVKFDELIRDKIILFINNYSFTNTIIKHGYDSLIQHKENEVINLKNGDEVTFNYHRQLNKLTICVNDEKVIEQFNANFDYEKNATKYYYQCVFYDKGKNNDIEIIENLETEDEQCKIYNEYIELSDH